MKYKTCGERIAIRIIELYDKIELLRNRYDILDIKYNGLLDEKEKLEEKIEKLKKEKDGTDLRGVEL